MASNLAAMASNCLQPNGCYTGSEHWRTLEELPEALRLELLRPRSTRLKAPLGHPKEGAIEGWARGPKIELREAGRSPKTVVHARVFCIMSQFWGEFESVSP